MFHEPISDVTGSNSSKKASRFNGTNEAAAYEENATFKKNTQWKNTEKKLKLFELKKNWNNFF